VPKVKIQGKWLRAFEFINGDTVEVQEQNTKHIITKIGKTVQKVK